MSMVAILYIVHVGATTVMAIDKIRRVRVPNFVLIKNTSNYTDMLDSYINVSPLENIN